MWQYWFHFFLAGNAEGTENKVKIGPIKRSVFHADTRPTETATKVSDKENRHIQPANGFRFGFSAILFSTIASLLFMGYCYIGAITGERGVGVGFYETMGTMAVFCGTMSWVFGRTFFAGKKAAASLVSVSPGTLNTLPAEEVLVRSSQEPEQNQCTVLLRATMNANTPAEELLRGSASSGQE